MGQQFTTRVCMGVTLVVFWGLTAYVAIAVFGSMLTELYGPPPKRLSSMQTGVDALSRRERTWCIGRLVGLKNQLDRRVASEIEGQENTSSRWSAWHVSWLADLDESSQRCRKASDPSIGAAYDQLLALHNGYDLAIVTLSRTRIDGVNKLRSTLKELENLPEH